MAVTAKQVQDLAMALIDEISETGSIALDNPEYYEAKTLSFLTTLQTELLPLSQTPEVITDLEQSLLLDDRTCLMVLPYGLAAHLLLQEDLSIASFFNDRYEELKRKKSSAIEPITDHYSILSGLGD